jgi:uncharacterized NAD(P)/FAD-binding protein YdhS
MSLVPGDDDHFAHWIAETNAVSDDSEALAPDGNLYPRRAVFGRYVAAQLAPCISSSQVTHVRDSVTNIAPQAGRWGLTTKSGRYDTADIVVLATTHPLPTVPAALERAFGADRRLIRDPSEAGVLNTIGRNARVLIVGTGLTMADVVASRDSRGHAGKITAISRRGLLSRGHAARYADPLGTFTGKPQTALSLLQQVRAEIRQADQNGLTWHPVIDAVRAQAQTFWPGLWRGRAKAHRPSASASKKAKLSSGLLSCFGVYCRTDLRRWTNHFRHGRSREGTELFGYRGKLGPKLGVCDGRRNSGDNRT